MRPTRRLWRADRPCGGRVGDLGSCYEGGDIGKRYRLIVLTTSAEREQTARGVLEHYRVPHASAGYRPVVSEIVPLGASYRAEDSLQQYLATHPFGYCGSDRHGVECSVGTS